MKHRWMDGWCAFALCLQNGWALSGSGELISSVLSCPSFCLLGQMLISLLLGAVLFSFLLRRSFQNPSSGRTCFQPEAKQLVGS